MHFCTAGHMRFLNDFDSHSVDDSLIDRLHRMSETAAHDQKHLRASFNDAVRDMRQSGIHVSEERLLNVTF